MRLFGTNNYSSSPKSGDVQVACLRVQVISCDGLEARDKKSNTSDPFVVVSLFGKQFKTPVCYRNVNPTYEKDATFDFPIYMSLVSELGTLKFVVWDKDMFGKDYLGDYSLPVNQWFNKTAFDFTGNEPFSVNLLSSRIKNPGTMLIKIGFAPHLSTSQSDFGEIYNELIASNNVGIVTVEIIGAKNLPNWPNGESFDFQCQIAADRS
ncbi:C2 domain-containing protein [Lactarius indigo]|nr:C2 domain-containing protein [Lactarius indigo]